VNGGKIIKYIIKLLLLLILKLNIMMIQYMLMRNAIAADAARIVKQEVKTNK
jgi:hypothetical protein